MDDFMSEDAADMTRKNFEQYRSLAREKETKMNSVIAGFCSIPGAGLLIGIAADYHWGLALAGSAATIYAAGYCLKEWKRYRQIRSRLDLLESNLEQRLKPS